VTVATLAKYGSPRASDHNDAVSSLDAVYISRHAIQAITLSRNQQIAADVTGNGQITSYDAAKVSQFAVELIDHFDAATSTGSDWKFLRCDHYVSADTQDCANPVFTHAPLAGTANDDFYAVLYGEVTGNWQPRTALAATAGPAPRGPMDPMDLRAESAFAAMDRTRAEDLRLLRGKITPRRAGSPPAVMQVTGWTGPLAAGRQRTIQILLRDADGIEGLDLSLHYDPATLRIVDVQKGALGQGLGMAVNDMRGDMRLALYGVLPLEGSGTLLTLTVEATGKTVTRLPRIEAQANEGRIPLRIRGNPVPLPRRNGELPVPPAAR
jgi:hypothetical protein